MAEYVVILGAGASKHSGVPLMQEFLDVAEDLYLEGAFGGEFQKEIGRVFDLIAELQSVYAKSYLDLANIEQLFGALEMAGIVRKLGNRSESEISSLRTGLIKLIVSTLEKKTQFRSEKGFVVAPRSYADLVSSLDSPSFNPKTAFITFNYDIALDYAFTNRYEMPGYCLSSDTSGIHLLKLHGSINWLYCKVCDEILAYGLTEREDTRSQAGLFRHQPLTLNVGGGIQKMIEAHGHELSNVPIIVPPTWNKTEYRGALSNVWSAAAKDLSEARYISVVGYSLPESDAFFRYLFALGTLGPTRIRKFRVFNPDPTGEVEARYRKLIGPGLAERFEYYRVPFEKVASSVFAESSTLRDIELNHKASLGLR